MSSLLITTTQPCYRDLMSQDGDYAVRSHTQYHLHAHVRDSALLTPHEHFDLVMCLFKVAKPLRCYHYQLPSLMSFTNLYRLGLTTRHQRLEYHMLSSFFCSLPPSVTIEHDDICHLIFFRSFFLCTGHPFHLGVNAQVQDSCELYFS